MVHTDNIAGRLHAILVAGRNLDRAKPARNAWRRLLLQKDEREDLFFRRFARLLEMPERLALQLADLYAADDDMLERQLRWRPNVEKVLAASLDTRWEEAIQHVADSTLVTLEYCAADLHRRRPERMPDGGVIDGIRSDVEAAIVECDGLDGETRTKISEQLVLLLEALDEVALFGTKAVEYATAAAFGSVLFASTEARGEDNRQALRDIGKRVWKAAADLNLSVSLVELPQRIQDLFPPNA